jgi:hypothetical protein
MTASTRIDLAHLVTASALLLATTPLTAHDFWIDLPSHLQKPGHAFPVRFLIGNVGSTKPWETLWRKIVSYRDYGPDGVHDHLADLHMTTAAEPGGATTTVAGAGTHVLAFESYQAENDITAEEFNAYAEHEGLTPALSKRKLDGTSATRGRELYSRRAKALVQLGNKATDNATQPIGQTLEVVPERNPYALADGTPLPIRIFYRGLPLAGASVVMERLDGQTAHGAPAITNADGRVSFPLVKDGRWRVGVVWTQPIVHPRAEFDTVFSSLTFGF